MCEVINLKIDSNLDSNNIRSLKIQHDLLKSAVKIHKIGCPLVVLRSYCPSSNNDDLKLDALLLWKTLEALHYIKCNP